MIWFPYVQKGVGETVLNVDFDGEKGKIEGKITTEDHRRDYFATN